MWVDSFVPLALKEKERRKEERATDSSARNGKLVAKLDLNESGKSDDGSATLGLYTSSLCHTKKIPQLNRSLLQRQTVIVRAGNSKTSENKEEKHGKRSVSKKKRKHFGAKSPTPAHSSIGFIAFPPSAQVARPLIPQASEAFSTRPKRSFVEAR